MSEEINWNLQLDESLLQDLYAWIDQIPLSRPKRKIERDFADGVMVAELIKFYFPNWIELHNYAAANNTQQKMINWGLLNRKVFQKFDMNVPENIMRGISLGKLGLVEVLLYNLRMKIDEYAFVSINIRHCFIFLIFTILAICTLWKQIRPIPNIGLFF
jgi:hypothetical protein